MESKQLCKNDDLSEECLEAMHQTINLINELLKSPDGAESKVDEILKSIDIWEGHLRQVMPSGTCLCFESMVITKAKILYYKYKNYEVARDETAAHKLIDKILELVTPFKDNIDIVDFSYMFMTATIHKSTIYIELEEYETAYDLICEAEKVYKRVFDPNNPNKEDNLNKSTCPIHRDPFLIYEKAFYRNFIAHYLVWSYGMSHINKAPRLTTHVPYLTPYIVPALNISIARIYEMAKKSALVGLNGTRITQELYLLNVIGHYKQLEHVLAYIMYQSANLRRLLPESSRPQFNVLQGVISFFYMAAGADIMSINLSIMAGKESNELEPFDNTTLEKIHDCDNDPAYKLYTDQFPLCLQTTQDGFIASLKKYVKKAKAWKKRGFELCAPELWPHFFKFVQTSVAKLDRLEKFLDVTNY